MVTFNSKHASEIEGLTYIGPYRRPLLAETKDSYSDIPGYDGSILQADNSKKNVTLEVDFVIQAGNNAELLNIANQVAEWLDVDDYKQLQFDDENSYYMAKVVSSIPLDRVADFKDFAEFTVTFTCLPYKLGEIQEEEYTTNAIAFTSSGNYKTPCLITVNMQTSTNKLEVSVNDAEISYTGELKNGDIVTIDSEELELRVNGALKVLEVDGYFSFLNRGINTISISQSAKTTVKWQERYYL